MIMVRGLGFDTYRGFVQWQFAVGREDTCCNLLRMANGSDLCYPLSRTCGDCANPSDAEEVFVYEVAEKFCSVLQKGQYPLSPSMSIEWILQV